MSDARCPSKADPGVTAQTSSRRLGSAGGQAADRGAEIRRTSESLLAALDLIPGYVYLQARDYTIPFANRGFREIFGDPAGRRCHEVMHGRSDPCEVCRTFRVFLTGTGMSWERTTADGRSFLIRDEPFAAPDGRELVLEVGIDITGRKRAERALQESESLLRGAFESSAVGFALARPTGELTAANTALTRMFGLDREALLTRMIHDLAHPEDAGAIGVAIERLLAGRGGRTTLEKRFRRGDGRILWASIAIGLVRDGQGQPLHLLIQLSDITAQREAQATLVEQQILLDEAEKLAHVGGWEWDITGDRLIATDEWMRIHGTRQPSLPREELFELAHPEDHERIGAQLETALRGEAPYDIEHRIVRADTKEVRIVHSRGEVVRNQDGRPVRMYGSCQDITARVHTERALRESEERYRMLTEHAGIGIGYYAADGRLVLLNRAAAKHLQVGPQELVGRTLEEIFGPEAGGRFHQRIRRAVASGETSEYEDEVPLPGGERHFLSTYAPIRDHDGTVQGVQVISHDISERKTAEERLRVASAASADLVYEWEIATDRLLWFGNVDRALGYDPQEIPRTIEGWMALIHPEDQQRLANSVAVHRESTGAIEERYRVLYKDGDWRWWFDRGLPLLDADGHPVKWIGSCRDITREYEAEAAIRAREAELEALFRHAPVGIVMARDPREPFRVNDAFCDFLGRTRQELESRPSLEIVRQISHPEDLEREMEQFARLQSGEIGEYRMQKRYRHKAGHYVLGDLQTRFVRDAEGRMLLGFSVVQPIPECLRA
ncbi:MAG: PAS domain S-box protein [Candidatus Eisenbacteria bacterium]|nr:PAS domain S-box protein [Candidatus Eisenbacteria bacterium]